MNPTTDATAKFVEHIYGSKFLKAGERTVRGAFMDLLNAEEVLSLFGRKQFTAAVGFIDMRGFSEQSKDKSPSEVRDLAAPFVASVVKAAEKQQCFVDKTIGDEVMVVIPRFQIISSGELCRREAGLVPEILGLLCYVLDFLGPESKTRFASGFGVGEVLLDTVGTAYFTEWTVYGNCVNAAKRLQSIAAASDSELSNRLSIGVNSLAEDWLLSELRLEDWASGRMRYMALPLINPTYCECELKGVGRHLALTCSVALEKGRP